MTPEDMKAIQDLSLKAGELYFRIKRTVENLEDHDDDYYYQHAHILDQLNNIDGRLSDLVNDIEKLQKLEAR